MRIHLHGDPEIIADHQFLIGRSERITRHQNMVAGNRQGNMHDLELVFGRHFIAAGDIPVAHHRAEFTSENGAIKIECLFGIAIEIQIGVQSCHVLKAFIICFVKTSSNYCICRWGITTILGAFCDIQFFYLWQVKEIAIIIPENVVIASVTDTLYMFKIVNDCLQKAGKPKLFNVQLVGFAKDIEVVDGFFSIKVDTLIENMKHADLIIVPAISGDVVRAIQLNRWFYNWLRTQYKNGAEIASFCMGAFLVGATGLLEGKKCSTHWLYAHEFRSYFPDVKLVDDKIITEQNGLYSSGGGTSYWNLLLYLVEKYTNREMAIYIAKFFLLDIERTSQSSFIMFRGQKEHGDLVVKRAQEYIEQHYAEKIGVEEIAIQLNTTRRTLERRFKKATSNSIVEYIHRVKVEAAKKQIELGRKTITEIMVAVGYSDTKTFRDLFRKITDLTPIEYKNKYSKKEK